MPHFLYNLYINHTKIIITKSLHCWLNFTLDNLAVFSTFHTKERMVIFMNEEGSQTRERK